MGNKYDKIDKIDNPLNEIKNIITDSKECSNENLKDHSNLNIIYSNENNLIVYRCPICLCIPFLYYNKLKITYICNCG